VVEVPVPLGLDDAGREVLTWVEGECGGPWPGPLRSPAGLAELARLLRRLHGALAGFDPGPDAVWRIGPRPLRPGEIVRHGDLGPFNVVYREGRPIGLIDWDLAEPGPPVADLGQLAWLAIPLRGERVWRQSGFTEPPDPGERLRALCAGYGGVAPAEVLDAALALMRESRRRQETWGRAGRPPWSQFVERGFLDELARDLERVERDRSSILAPGAGPGRS
jgi:hypothetical protein